MARRWMSDTADGYRGPEETMPERDAMADCSRTGPPVTREDAMTDIPPWAHAPQPVPTGNRETLAKDRPAG